MFILLSVLPLILLPIFLSLTDFVTLIRSKKKRAHRLDYNTQEDSDFSLLVPIFGDMKYLKNVEFLKLYSNHVILCTTTKETEEFNKNIKKVAAENDFRIFRSEVPLATSKSKPNPWRLFSNTLKGDIAVAFNRDIARDEIIRDSFEAVGTKYCIFIDGDTVAKESLYKLVGLMAQTDWDVASVRILVSKKNTVMEKLQAVEYELAMDARKVYPWLTSGAGVVAKTEAIRNVMKNHSLFFSGGDIEIGRLAGLLKHKVGHLHFEFYTDVPSTFKAWFKQRMVWFGGGFRHAVINSYDYLKHPWFFLYFTVLVYLATPLRWYELYKRPLVLPFVIVLYWILVFAFNWKDKGWYLFLFPFYSLLQVMVLIPLGIYTYFKMAIFSDNVGLIKIREKRSLVK